MELGATLTEVGKGTARWEFEEDERRRYMIIIKNFLRVPRILMRLLCPKNSNQGKGKGVP